MDEHQGYLRLATTSGQVPDPGAHSTLTVFAERALDSGKPACVNILTDISVSPQNPG